MTSFLDISSPLEMAGGTLHSSPSQHDSALVYGAAAVRSRGYQQTEQNICTYGSSLQVEAGAQQFFFYLLPYLPLGLNDIQVKPDHHLSHTRSKLREIRLLVRIGWCPSQINISQVIERIRLECHREEFGVILNEGLAGRGNKIIRLCTGNQETASDTI